MIDKLKSLIKENTTPLIFFGVIIFLIGSYYSNYLTTQRQAQELLDFTNSSTSDIRVRTTELANSSLILSNTLENYPPIIAALQEMESTLSQQQNNIPNKPISNESKKLMDELAIFFAGVKQDVSTITVRTQFVYNNSENMRVVSTLKNTLEKGSLEEVNQLLNALVQVENNLKQLESSSLRTYINTVYFNGFDEIILVLPEIQQLIPSNDNPLILEQNRSTILQKVEIWNDKPTLPFPIIRRDDIENQEFFAAIERLQTEYKAVKSEYSL